MDDAATTGQLSTELGLEFAVGHSADAPEVPEIIGAFVNPDPVHPRSACFVRPGRQGCGGRLLTDAIGRPAPEDVLGFVRRLKEHNG